MALEKPQKHTGAGTWPTFAVYLFADILKVLLLLLPVLGEVLDFIISIVLEVIIGGLGLFFSGFFRSGPESNSNVLWFMGLASANLVPLVDGLPFTSPAIFIRIRATQKADAKALQEYEKSIAAKNASQQQSQQLKIQAAQIAAQNARTGGQQAMATSIAVAQTHTPSFAATASPRRPLPDGRLRPSPRVPPQSYSQHAPESKTA